MKPSNFVRDLASFFGIGSSVGGDLGGTIPNPVVRGIQGVPVTDVPPTDGQELVYSATAGKLIYAADPPPAGLLTLASGAVSKPPTEAELVAVLGVPGAPAMFLLKDTGTGYHYLVASDGLAYQLVPMVLASGAAPAVFSLTAAPEGGWCWFADARAIYDGGFTYFGYVDSAGNVKARSYNHSTGVVSGASVLYPSFQVDDHVNPSLLIRASDSHILASFSTHAGPDISIAIGPSAGFISVSVGPGWIALIVIRRAPKSRARPRTMPCIADLVIA